MKVGEVRCSQSFLEFPDAPVTFRLIQGKGPVHIHGHHLVGVDDETAEEEVEDEELDEIVEDEGEDDEPQKKKQKTAANSKGAKNDKNSKKK